MQARIEKPALSVSDTLEAFQKLGASATTAGIPETTLHLVHLRASQINGCSVCADIHSRELERAGESSERILTVAAWRETPYFSDAERAALALTEAATRLADRPDPVPDQVWNEAARHYSEPQLAALVVAIAAINAFNRVSAATRQISGAWVAHAVRTARRVELPDQSTSRRSAGPDESPVRLDLIQDREIVVRDSLMFLARNFATSLRLVTEGAVRADDIVPSGLEGLDGATGAFRAPIKPQECEVLVRL